MRLTDFYLKAFGVTSLWGLNLGFYLSMLIVTVIVLIQNIVFWSMKRKPVDADELLIAIRNDCDTDVIAYLVETGCEHGSGDLYLLEALRCQSHEQVLRLIFQSFSFSQEIRSSRYMLEALENPNPEVTRVYLENCTG